MGFVVGIVAVVAVEVVCEGGGGGRRGETAAVDAAGSGERKGGGGAVSWWQGGRLLVTSHWGAPLAACCHPSRPVLPLALQNCGPHSGMSRRSPAPVIVRERATSATDLGWRCPEAEGRPWAPPTPFHLPLLNPPPIQY